MIAGYIAVLLSPKQRLRIGTPSLCVGTLTTLATHPLAPFFVKMAALQGADRRAALSWSQRNIATGCLVTGLEVNVG